MINFIIISLLTFIAIIFLLNVSINRKIKKCLEDDSYLIGLEKEICRLQLHIAKILDHEDMPDSIKKDCHILFNIQFFKVSDKINNMYYYKSTP